jgi:hemerythrin-like metal-binding protein
MKEIQWDDRLSVGISDIDEQHRKLLELCNKAFQAISKGMTEVKFKEITAELRQFVKLHFTAEEELMEKYKYPRRDEHHAEHVKLTKTVKDFHSSTYRHEQIPPEELKAFLTDWIVNHIIRHDLGYAKYFKEKGVVTS